MQWRGEFSICWDSAVGGFWLMDREICTGILGHKEGCPKELLLTLAYLHDQGWEPSLSGHSEEEEEGDWKGKPPARPVQSNQVCEV